MGKSSTKAKNKYNNLNYDRIGIMLPKGKKELWQQIAKEKGLSLNALIIKAVDEIIKNKK